MSSSTFVGKSGGSEVAHILRRHAVDQLVAMRIHRVTPDYISDLSDHRLKDLTIDKLIRLGIHGID